MGHRYQMHRDACEEALAAIAPLMERLTASPDATFFYDLMSGGIIWKDEFPRFSDLRIVPGWGIIRILLRHRTTLIIGRADVEVYAEDDMRFCWDRGLFHFPNWPGFDPRRRSPDLRPEVLRLEQQGLRHLEEDVP